MIQIIDLGVNNLRSLVESIREVSGESPEVVHDAHEITNPNLLILPGTGAFGKAVRILETRGFRNVLSAWRQNDRGWLLGVCLGMQLLFETSEEDPGFQGLGLISGHVRHLTGIGSGSERVPHVGWSEANRDDEESFSWANIDNGRDFYFSHSYAVENVPMDIRDVMTTTFGTAQFVSGVRKDNVLGFQFHPEKSSFAGLQLLAAVVEGARQNA